MLPVFTPISRLIGSSKELMVDIFLLLKADWVTVEVARLGCLHRGATLPGCMLRGFAEWIRSPPSGGGKPCVSGKVFRNQNTGPRPVPPVTGSQEAFPKSKLGFSAGKTCVVSAGKMPGVSAAKTSVRRSD